ncbi:MAG: arginine--tRNA ligase [Ruminococcaceae bacterium]|nr:arginine--tRNA ligase [Oscillospiraceae bacterium]
MLEIKKSISESIAQGIKAINSDASLEISDIASMLEYPPDEKMGDLALPCFKLSKTLRRSPVQIAQTLADGMSTPCVARAEAVNGYLNIFLDGAYLASRVIPETRAKGDKYGAPTDLGEGKTVVLDYSSPNLAKPFHIGHLGTTVIGHSLKMLHEFAGYKCIGINYVGDWGTQFGKLIVAYKKWGDREKVENGGVDALVELYVKINNAISGNEEEGISADPTLADEARAEFLKMEQGDEENLALWRWLVKLSLKANDEIYRQLGITFDSYKGESSYTEGMPVQVQRLRDKGLLKIDDGASIVDLEEYGMPPCLILKRDGSSLYPTRDIAAAYDRKQMYDFDKSIYVTSAGQSLHFAQWFKVVELMGYDWFDKLVHVPYGTVSINGAKLATRTGNVILLRDLFALAIEKVAAIMEEKNPNIENKEKTAEAVGVGAVIFYYLSNNRIRDINFVMEDALSFDGNTGPYVQYTYARTCSVLSKSGEYDKNAELLITSEDETSLLKTLSRFEEVVRDAIDAYEPSIVTRYILDVAGAYNRFYHNCSILGAENEQIKNTRLAITEATKTVLGNAFGLICLKKTEKI